MNRIAAKVSEKVTVLLQDYDFHAGSCQQEAQHHSRWATASDTAAHVQFRSWILLRGHLAGPQNDLQASQPEHYPVDFAILVNNMAHARVLFPRFAIFSIGSVKNPSEPRRNKCQNLFSLCSPSHVFL